MKNLHLIEARPTTIPSGNAAGKEIPTHWMICNAPRPIYASFIPNSDDPAAWQGDFRHGIFYVAVDPAERTAIKMNEDLDAWNLVYHSMDEVIKWGRAYCETRKIDFNDFEPSDFRDSFLLRANRGEFDKPKESEE